MRNTTLAALAVLALGGAAGPAFAQAPAPAEEAATALLALDAQGFGNPQDRDYQRGGGYDDGRYQRMRVNVWLDDQRDIFRVGDRTRVRLRTSEDAYVAVLHIDTNGDVEFLYPRSPSDDGYVQGGRTYSLPFYGSQWLSIRGGYGIGYVFAVASDEPLDLYRYRDLFYGRRAAGWNREYSVYGDPFYAMERYERGLVPDWDYGYHDSDVASYHVGRRYTHPRYACYDSYGAWYSSRSAYYSDCDVVRILLRERPYYYDTRYYRGDRRVYYGRYYRYGDYRERYGSADRRDPPHRYKEETGERGGSTRGGAPPRRPEVSGGSSSQEGGQDRSRYSGQEGERVAPPSRERPTLQRRPPTTEPLRRGGGEAREEPRRDEPRRVEPRREAPQPRQVEPRREEPRRESPPVRREEPRRESPPARREEPRRESPPPRRDDDGGSSTRTRPESSARVRPPAG